MEIKYNKRDIFNKLTLDLALNIADYQVGKLLDFQNQRGGRVWVVSALGQEAIDWGDYIPEITLDSENDFLMKLDLNESNYKFSLLCIQISISSAKVNYL